MGETMMALSLTLALVTQAVLGGVADATDDGESFRARVVVEEGGVESSYVVHFGPGRIRIEPPEEQVYLLLEVSPIALTLVRPDRSRYYRVEPSALPGLMAAGIVKSSWFPWVTAVSPDLMEGVSLEPRGKTTLPDGRSGLLYIGDSPTYRRAVARYSLDPSASARRFFQWREFYFELWGGEATEAEAAQKKRLELYATLPHLPVISEERFLFLSRPRTVRIEERDRIPEGAFTIPDHYEEKEVRELYWEFLGERLLRQLGMRGSDPGFGAGQSH